MNDWTVSPINYCCWSQEEIEKMNMDVLQEDSFYDD